MQATCFSQLPVFMASSSLFYAETWAQYQSALSMQLFISKHQTTSWVDEQEMLMLPYKTEELMTSFSMKNIEMTCRVNMFWRSESNMEQSSPCQSKTNIAVEGGILFLVQNLCQRAGFKSSSYFIMKTYNFGIQLPLSLMWSHAAV